MKTIMKSIAITAVMLSVAIGSAKEPKLSVIVENGTKSLVVEYDNQLKEANIRFVDNGNHVIFSEDLDKYKVYAKKFDLKDLETGNYFLEFEDSLMELVFDIHVEEKKVTIEERRENVKPVFRTKGEKVFLNLLNLDGSKVEIKVYDSQNRLVFKESSNGEMLVEKVFNFEKAFEDNYFIAVKDNDEVYYKDVIVD